MPFRRQEPAPDVPGRRHTEPDRPGVRFSVNANKLALVQSIIDKMRVFVDQVYVPDTIAVAGFYKDWF